MIFLLIASVVIAQQPASKPEAALAGLVKTFYGMGQPTDWEGIEKLAGVKWGPGPTELKNCLPSGDCYARQGAGLVGGLKLAVVATGARTMVMNIMVRNMSAPLGEAALVGALTSAGFTAELARCPVKSGGTSWYRLKGGLAPGVISIQPAGPGRPNEGYVLSQGEDLPALQPNQLALFTEQCAAGVERKPVSTAKPHELLADLVVALLAPTAGFLDWKAFAGLSTGIKLFGEGPKAMDLTSRGDANPVAQTGAIELAGRKFAVLVAGTPTQVKAVYLDESGLHPKGEHMLGVVYERGFAVRLVRCGPVYTQSTNNWYSVTSAKTKPANVRQSISYDGNNVSDAYALRLDGTLPTRDPRDRDPGRNGC